MADAPQITVHKIYTDRHGAPYLVRDARPEDGPAMVELLNRVGQEQIYIADEYAQLTSEQEAQVILRRNPAVQCILVAEQSGNIAGSLEMIRGTMQKNRHTAVFGMALFPDFRGRGLGGGLLTAAEEWARATGVEKVTLAVFATNTPAIRMYQRLGYEEEGRRRAQYRIQDQWVDEIYMARWLTRAPH
jgi:ribosomal protein S18 acetylase RimI-like enzyme